MIQSAELRVCPHFRSGCCIDCPQIYPPVWNEVQKFFKDQGFIQPTLHCGPVFYWRCRSKLAVRGSFKNPLIGLFKKGTHEVMPISCCQMHHPRINEAIHRIREFLSFYQLTPYQEQGHQGELRYLQFVVERSSQSIQVSFVLNFANLSHPRVKHWMDLLKKLGEENQHFTWHSLWINLNSQPTNTIFGSTWKLVYGKELLWETFDHISVCYQPASFAQANLDLFEKLLQRMKELLLENARVVEFYAGVGVMALYLASKCHFIRCVELNPHAIDCFNQSKSCLPMQDAAKLTFHTGLSRELLNLLQDANVLIADPPRKGLEPSLLIEICRTTSVKQFIYVSCGWLSFKRDFQALIENGWMLNHAEGYLFFPGSNHIEILAEFKRE
jgi:tRNA/tmRNA/rRNA uracil-C5-methylase (TrmA/RlmC/RlmD family)